MTERGLVQSRSRAKALITEGKVCLNCRPLTKPAELVEDSDVLTLEADLPFVGRGGLKLAHHLAGDSAVLKFFSAGIYSRERAFAVGTADHGTIHFGMHHVQAAVEFRGLAEE